MTLGPSDATNRPETGGPRSVAAEDNDVSIVPGLGDPVPAPRADAAPGARRPPSMDMSKDPDRFDPDRVEHPDPVHAPTVVGPLDMRKDPDRMPRPGEGQSLTDLLGRGAMEDERNNYTWAIGLISVFAFLALVAWLFGEVLSGY